jgi:hypothetical protein
VPFGSATAITFTAGIAEASTGAGGKVVLYKSGATNIMATGGTVSTPTALTFTPPPGAATKLVLSSSTTMPVVGTGFNLTTTARDTYGNVATAYTGSKNVTFSGAGASPSGTLLSVVNAAGTAIDFGSATSLTFSSGVATVSSSKNGFAKLYNAAPTSVTASDGTISTPPPLSPSVSPRRRRPRRPQRPRASAGSVGSRGSQSLARPHSRQIDDEMTSSSTALAKPNIRDAVARKSPLCKDRSLPQPHQAGPALGHSGLDTRQRQRRGSVPAPPP